MEHLKRIRAFAALLVIAAAQNITHSLDHKPTYVVLAPRSLQAGRPTSLSVSVLTDSALTVMARIVHDNVSVASQKLEMEGGSTQLVTLPPVTFTESRPYMPYTLEVKGYAGSRHVFSNTTYLYFEPRSCMTFIHTDKDSYGAGQLIRFWVVSLQDAMKPCNHSADIMIKDPRGNLLQQWRSAQPLLGVLSKEFRLSREPLLGPWTITAQIDGGATHKHVQVDEYAMPKFKVMMDLPDVLHYEDTLCGTITARYKSGQPVSGRVNITVVHRYHGMQEIYDENGRIDGSMDFKFVLPEFHAKSDSDYSAKMYDDGQYLEVVAHVTEDLTDVSVYSKARVRLVQQTYQLYFADYPKILKPSMSFMTTVHVCKSNKEPLSEEDTMKVLKVSVMQQSWCNGWMPSMHNQSGSDHNYPDSSLDMEFPIPADGVVHVHFLLTKDTQALAIHASVEDSYQTLQLCSSYMSPSYSYIQVLSVSGATEIQVGSPFTLYVNATFPVTAIHYLVKCGDDIVSAGRGSRKLTLIPKTSWMPMVSVVVFLVREDGEMVNDVICLDVHPFLHNQVSLSWSEPETRPGDEVTLRVSAAEAGSLVGIMVQDKVPWWAEPKGHDTKEMTDMYHSSTGTQYSQHMGMGDPLSVFMWCQLSVLTDACVHATYPQMAEGGDYYSPYHMDSEYQDEEDYMWKSEGCPPETWIWTEMFTDDSGSAEMRVTVPDSITNWTAIAFVMSHTLGLGISWTPARLSVTKKLLMSVHMPPVVTLGEEMLLEVRFFNNYDEDLEVMMAVEQNDTFELVLADESQLLVRRLLLARESAASVPVPIRPLVLGDLTVMVKAKSYVGMDMAQGTVLVKAEGVEQSFSSALLLDVSSSLSTMMTFMFPDDVVAGSKKAWLTLVGDMLGPSIQGLDSLIQMPYGCGEQNMINFAPNIYVLLYLNATAQDRQDVKDTAVSFMESGYVQELSYQRADGSFSAFGERDASGSTWLTAFVLRCFLQARPFISIDEHVVQVAATWLVGQQMADGQFQEVGRVIHTELQGGLNGPVSLTAYVLIALLEDPHVRAQYADQVASALMFLERQLAAGDVSSNYSLSLVAYALAMNGSANAHTTLDQLIARADMIDGIPRWTSPAAGLTSSWQPSSAEIETAAYALLSLCKLGRLVEGGDLLKWLGRQRNPTGGFGSTQDTVVALQALSTASILLHRQDVNLKVRVNDSVFHVNEENRNLMQTRQVEPKEHLYLQVKAEGQGLVVLQLNARYNVRTNEPSRRRRYADPLEAFNVHVDFFDDDDQGLRAHLDVCCSLHQGGALNATGMALAEIGLLSGFSLEHNVIQINDFVKNVETRAGKVILYFDSITTKMECVRIPLLVEYKVAKVQEAIVLIYDYYEPRRRTVRTYGSEWREHVDSCWFCGDGCHQCLGDDDWTDISTSSSLRIRPQLTLLLFIVMMTLQQL